MANIQRLTWLFAALVWLLVARQASAVAIDCSTMPNPPSSEPFRIVTGNTTLGGCPGNSGAASGGVIYPTIGALQSAITSKVAPYNLGSAANTISSIMYCGESPAGTQWYDQRWLYGSSPKHQSFKVEPGGDTTCEEPPAEEPFDCSTLANVKSLGSANDQPDSFEPGETICVKNGKVGGTPTPMNCAAFKNAKQSWKRLGPSGARDWLAGYQFTGLECDAEPQQVPTEPMDTDDESEKCQTGSGGLTYCNAPQDDTDCGFFNDKYVCLKSLGNDKCVTKADGSRICASGAPTPPVPDNGTPGVPATPDDTMQTVDPTTGTTNNYNYYNSTTNAGSGRDTGSGGNTDGSGTVGPGGITDGGGEGEGTGDDPTSDDSASGGATCDAAPVCDGDPIACAQLQQQWRIRCPIPLTVEETIAAASLSEAELSGDLTGGASPIDLAGSVSESSPLAGASCPTGISVSVMGQTIELDVWEQACNMALLFAPVVMALAYLASALMLVRSLR